MVPHLTKDSKHPSDIFKCPEIGCSVRSTRMYIHDTIRLDRLKLSQKFKVKIKAILEHLAMLGMKMTMKT